MAIPLTLITCELYISKTVIVYANLCNYNSTPSPGKEGKQMWMVPQPSLNPFYVHVISLPYHMFSLSLRHTDGSKLQHEHIGRRREATSLYFKRPRWRDMRWSRWRMTWTGSGLPDALPGTLTCPTCTSSCSANTCAP